MHDPDLDALRRAVYAPGAGEVDRERYRLALAAVAPPVPAESGVEPGPTAPPAGPPVVATPARGFRVGRRTVIAAVAVAVTGAATVGVARSLPRPPAGRTVTYDLDAKRSLVRGLERGGQAGILRDLAMHPEHASPTLRDDRVRARTEVFGRGDTTVRLEPARPVGGAGRATVILLLAEAAEVTWTAYTLRRSIDGPRPFFLIRDPIGRRVTGEPRVRSARFRAGDAPVFLRVEVPNDVRWGAAVLYSD